MEGLGKALRRLSGYTQKVDDVTDAQLTKTADRVLKGAQDLAPKATGRLAASGEVNRISDDVRQVLFDAPYAVIVHEDMAAQHSNGKAKFLELSLKQNTRPAFVGVARNLRRIR